MKDVGEHAQLLHPAAASGGAETLFVSPSTSFMKKQHFIVHHGTYPFDILISIGHSDTECCKIIERKTGYKLNQDERKAIKLTGNGRTAMIEGSQTVMRLALVKTKVQFHSLLAHEIFHAVEFLFDRIGLKYSLDAGEAFAYQIQVLTYQIYSKLKL